MWVVKLLPSLRSIRTLCDQHCKLFSWIHRRRMLKVSLVNGVFCLFNELITNHKQVDQSDVKKRNRGGPSELWQIYGLYDFDVLLTGTKWFRWSLQRSALIGMVPLNALNLNAGNFCCRNFIWIDRLVDVGNKVIVLVLIWYA